MSIKNLLFLLVLGVALIGLSGCSHSDKQANNQPPAENNQEEQNQDEVSAAEVLGRTETVDNVEYKIMFRTQEGDTFENSVWRLNNKMKTRTIVEGNEIIYIMDNDEQVAYSYMPDQNMAIKMDFGQANTKAGETAEDQAEEAMANQPEIVGYEEVDGKQTVVMQYTEGDMTVKMWVWQRRGLPLKVETESPEGTTLMQLRDIQIGSVTEADVSLPEGVEVTDIPNIPNMNLDY